MENTTINTEVWLLAWRQLDLRSMQYWLKKLGFVAEVPRLPVIPVVHLYEEDGHGMGFNEDYSVVTAVRKGSVVEAPCVESCIRVDGVRAALTSSALYIHHPKDAP